MKSLPILLWSLVLLLVVTESASFGGIPQIISYQGKVSASGSPVNGTGLFKFALVNGDGTTSYWSNDGMSNGGSEPVAAVSLNVANGLYSVLLGDVALTNMAVLPSTVFNNSDVRLRIWFSDGVHGFALLTPDQRIAAVGYAIMAGNVQDGAITSAKIAAGAIGGGQIADGAVSSAKIATGAIGSAQMANGAVGAAQLADSAVTAAKISAGAITADKLAKPLRSGTVSSSSLSIDYFGGGFTVPFNPAFASVPNVTLTLDAAEGSAAGTARLQLTGRSASQFTGIITGASGALAAALPATLDGVATGSAGNIGDYACIKPINEFPAVAYFDTTNGDLLFVRATNLNGTAWGTPVVVDSSGNVGTWISMETVDGFPAICYHDETNGDLKYVIAANENGTAWRAPVVVDSTGNVGTYNSLAVVGSRPAIGYYDVTNKRLKYVRANDLDGLGWGTPVVVDSSTGNVGEYCSLLTVGGRPAMSYVDSEGNYLRYVRATDTVGSAWGTPIQAAGETEVNQTCLAFVNGAPAIVYQGRTLTGVKGSYHHWLRYVRATDSVGATWGGYVQPDPSDGIGSRSCLIVANDRPAISYFDGHSQRFVRAADGNGDTWGTPLTLDSDNPAGMYTSLTMINGNPAVGYLATTSSGRNCLRFTRSQDAEGTTWSAPATVDGLGLAGLQPSLKMVNGNPAISYYDETNGALKFMRANDAAGSSWGTPITLDTAGDVGQHGSMTIVNGNPAISYFDLVNRCLKYIRATDANGTAWGSPVTVDASVPVGQYTSLVMVNGCPAIAYFQYDFYSLRYVRATDANGTAWGTPKVLDSGLGSGVTKGAGQWSSMAVVNGNPAISYYDRSGPVRYIRALDATGSTWDSAVTVEFAGTNIEVRTSLAVVNGRPAISYNNNSDQLKYSRANDDTGASWSVFTVVDMNTKATHSLAVVNGFPVITYRSGDFKAVQGSDANGSVWGKPVVLDSSINVGFWSSAAAIGNQLGAAYFDAENQDLKFVRAGSPIPFAILWMAQEP